MSNRATWNGAALSLLIVSALIVGVFAAILASAPVVRAGQCDEVSDVISGDWTINTVQECAGIVYRVDGTINIDGPGSLTLRNGGIIFTKDAANPGHSLNVNAGGSLILDNSFVTTELVAIDPYIHLALTVSGANSALTMRNGAMLKFPGWFNATSATMNITDSTITGFQDIELAQTGLEPADDYNDGPVIDWIATTANFYRSRIERIYEGAAAANVALTGSSTLYAYDTYIGVDYSNEPGLHSALTVDGTSRAFLYAVTIDRDQDPPLRSNWTSAFVPAPGGNVYLLRWARVIAVDSTGFPITDTSVSATLSPSNTPAQYPDSGSGTPTQQTRWYLGQTGYFWDRTNPSGEARVPLYTDQITSATLPNADSFGNYAIAATYNGSTVTGGVAFPSYPAINAADNSRTLPLSFNVQVRTGPDLNLRQSDYPTTETRIQNQPFNLDVTIYNSGQTDATSVSIAGYLDGIRDPVNEVARASGLSIVRGTQLDRTLNVRALPVSGAHTIMLVVDPDRAIIEGGPAQENNNFANVSVFLQPPPDGFVAIGEPSSGQTVQPGTQLRVTGFVREPDSTGIFDIEVFVNLTQGGSVIASRSVTSGEDGYFEATLDVPSGLADGSYDLLVTPRVDTITGDIRALRVTTTTPLLSTPLPILGIPLWLFLIVLAAGAAIAIGLSLYIKVYGLGKMVECGECGAFIPEDATSCPKCGVEFEKDMAKCSNCQAWIPVDVKQCPECGVEFATGEVEMADYQEKMRLRYDEVVLKFKEEATRQLGRALSDREFQEWWRKQPTFVTFEDWLREEEDMRKMGSKPCPTCGTLNSVTATVCHKCGSLMREAPRPPSGGAGGPPSAIQSRRPAGAAPPEPPSVGAAPYPPPGAPAGTETIPRRVIRKPVTPQPVVQKKIVKKPMGESQEGEGQSDSSGKSEDEL